MQTSIKKLAAIVMGIMLTASVQLYANSADDKTVEKSREAVENADPNDWKTLSYNADKCFRKKINTEEALEWINRSIEIDANPTNLTVMGDYYYRNEMPEKAIHYYLQAMAKNGHGQNELVAEAIQVRIQKAKTMMDNQK